MNLWRLAVCCMLTNTVIFLQKLIAHLLAGEVQEDLVQEILGGSSSGSGDSVDHSGAPPTNLHSDD